MQIDSKFSELFNLLNDNEASIFASFLKLKFTIQPSEIERDFTKYITNSIFVPPNDVIDFVLKQTNLTLEQFIESNDFNEIILNHIEENHWKSFNMSTMKNDKKQIIPTIDGAPIFDTIKIPINGKMLKVNFIGGMLVTPKQRDHLLNLSSVLSKCPKPSCPEIMVQSNNEENYDKFGYDIFKIFDLKYTKANRIFERAANKVLTLYQQKRLTNQGRDYLANIIDLYSEAYIKFVKQVVDTRTYTPKASSGAKPIKIETAKDWAEAIIEFNDLITKFNQIFEETVKVRSSSTTLKEECEVKSVKDCIYPCEVSKGLVYSTCTYK